MFLNMMRGHIASIILLFSFFSAGCIKETLYWNADDAARLRQWLNESRSHPRELVSTELNAGRSLVFAQSNALRADSVDLVKTLVPILHDGGVRRIMAFFIHETREFSLDPSLSYSKYDDFIEYLSQFNEALRADETAMELHGLATIGGISAVKIKSTMELLLPESSETGDYSASKPIFIWILQDDLSTVDAVISEIGLDSQQKVPLPYIIFHHGPSNTEWSALFNQVLANYNIEKKTFAFSGADAPFPSFKKLPGFIENQIYIVSSFPYAAVVPLEGFISSMNASLVLPYFTNISIRRPQWWSARLMNQFLARKSKKYKRFAAKKQKLRP